MISPVHQQELHLLLSGATLPNDPASAPGAQILVVDPDQTRRNLAARLLNDNGYSAQTVQSGILAVERIRESPPDLVLLTIDSWSMDAGGTLRSIRQLHAESSLPVITIAEIAIPHLGAVAFREGASDFLIHPCDTEILLARIALHLRHKRDRAELQHSQERYALAAQGAQIGLWDLDVARQQIFLSSRWKELLGFTNEELDATIPNWLDRMHPDDRDAFMEMISKPENSGDDRFDYEIRMLHRDNSYRWMLCSGVMQTDSAGRVLRLAGSLADVTEAKVRDALTGLPNRLLFEEQLKRIISLDPQRYGMSAVLFLDLDDFKRINDNYGHDAGDLLLCSVARKLEGCLRGADVIARQKSGWSVARHGGDEFTILLHQLHERADAEHVAERIIAALAEPFLIGSREVTIGVSIGLAFGGGAGKTSADAIREADTAMYYAKTAGRGRYCIFDPEMQAGATAKLTLENELRHAIRSHEFYLVYQPVVRLSSGCIEGFEALCRWKHPRGANVGPDVFVPLAESLGLTNRLGRMILEDACEEVLKWNDPATGSPGISVTVNCSSEEFGQPSFKHDLLLIMSKIGIDPHTLKLEVNEAALLAKPDQTHIFMNELRDLGIRIGIDDFGTGYSSLAFLHRIPLDLLKIDHSFVQNMLKCSETRDVVRTIINLAQNLDLDVVAEGVETAEQRDQLYEMGCTHAQGFFYSCPIPGHEIPELLERSRRAPLVPRSMREQDSESARIETQLQNIDDLMRQQ